MARHVQTQVANQLPIGRLNRVVNIWARRRFNTLLLFRRGDLTCDDERPARLKIKYGMQLKHVWCQVASGSQLHGGVKLGF